MTQPSHTIMSQRTGSVSTLSLASSGLTQIAQTSPHEIDGFLLDYLLIEIIGGFRRSAVIARQRLEKYEKEMISIGMLPESINKKDNLSKDDHDALIQRLETAGKHVGANLCERCAQHQPLFALTRLSNCAISD